MNFENKTVLVTGANRGIGQAIVKELLKKNVKKVYATARDLKNLPDFSDNRVVGLSLDITNLDQVKSAVSTASDTDILINNAGVAAMASLLTSPVEDLKRDMDTNYYGTLNMVREFVPALEAKKDSAIVNVVTIGAFVNFPNIGGYSASKAALFSMSQGIRIELQTKGIAVHTVNPGPIDTDMTKDFQMDKTSPQITAENIVNSLEQGEVDIFPDPGSKGMFDLWNSNYRDLENAVSQMFHS